MHLNGRPSALAVSSSPRAVLAAVGAAAVRVFLRRPPASKSLCSRRAQLEICISSLRLLKPAERGGTSLGHERSRDKATRGGRRLVCVPKLVAARRRRDFTPLECTRFDKATMHVKELPTTPL
jgi:hypothetical protein